MRFRLLAALCMAAPLLASIPGDSSAHEGHDHGETAAPAPANIAPRGEAASKDFELVAVVQGQDLLIYLDRFDTNAPVTDAVIEVETPNGAAEAVAEAGAYRLAAPWLAGQANADLIFSVAAGNVTDILSLTIARSVTSPDRSAPSILERIKGWLQPAILVAGLVGMLVGGILASLLRSRRAAMLAIALASAILSGGHARAHEGEDHAKPAALGAVSERALRLPDGTVYVPKPVQRIFELRTVLTETATHRRTIELPGRIIPDPNASGFVQAAVGGRLAPPEAGFPRLGTTVKKGDVLAYVTPPLQAIDVSDMRQRQGELDQQIDIVGRRVTRFERLAPTGAVAQVQLDESRLELQGLKDRRAALDRARGEPEALIAPVSGVIAEGTPVAGQMAQPNAVIFHIVDPAKLWVEALSFEAPGGAEEAAALTAGGRRLALTYRGAGFADRSQSIPVHFAIEGGANDLRAGQLVTVRVTAPGEKKGIALPRASLVRSQNGQDFIYEHVSAERFVARAVRAETLDGERVLILSGVEAGKRIVTQSAELLDHVR